MNYPKEIKKHREIAQMTQLQLAKKMGVTVTYVANVEQGLKKISGDQFDRILKALGFKVLRTIVK